MKTVLKYPLARMKRQTIKMPAGATILTAMGQHEVGCIWALCEPGINEVRTLVCINTGKPVPDGLTYIGTVSIHEGHTIFHVFEEK